MLLASWLRYAGTADSLSPTSKYALMLIAQVCSVQVGASAFILTMLPDDRRHLAAHIPGHRPVVLRDMVRPQLPHDRDNDHRHRCATLTTYSEAALTPFAANPLGSALGQLLSPILSDPKASVRPWRSLARSGP